MESNSDFCSFKGVTCVALTVVNGVFINWLLFIRCLCVCVDAYSDRDDHGTVDENHGTDDDRQFQFSTERRHRRRCHRYERMI